MTKRTASMSSARPAADQLSPSAARQLVVELQAERDRLLRQNQELRQQQTQLLAHSNLVQELLGAAPIGFAYLDRQLRYQLVNDWLAAINGRPVADHLGRTVAEIIPSLNPIAQQLAAQVLATGQPVKDCVISGEAPLQPGQIHHWNESWFPLHDTAGAIVGFGVVVEEITARQQAEAALRTFKEALENATDAVGMSTPQGRHHYQNQAFTDLFGKIGDNPPATLYCDPAVGRQVFRTIMAGGSWTGEVEMHASDRRVLQILLRAYATRDEQGKISGLVGVHTDITARKQAEEELCQFARTLEQRVAKRTTELLQVNAELERATQLQQLALDAANLGRWHFEPKSQTTWWDKRCQEIFGVAKDVQPTPQLCAQIVHPDDWPAVVAKLTAVLKSSSPRQTAIELRLNRPDGQTRHLKTDCLVLFAGRGKKRQATLLLGTVADISESKRLEEAVERVSENERQRIGHDLHDGLGQLLTGISFLASAVKTSLDRKAAPEAADLNKLVGHIQKAIRQTRELARGLFVDEFAPENLRPALKELAATTTDIFGIPCRLRAHAPVALADANQARQLYRIAQEAVNNAVKHSQAKKIHIDLQKRQRHTTLTVQDDGIGMRRPAKRLDSMGLRIMQCRANLIGATLHLDSPPGHGTTVTCILPQPKMPVPDQE